MREPIDHPTGDAPDYETYRVIGKTKVLDFVVQAIEQCGGRILQQPKPSQAPFPFTILTPTGEIVRLLCYAFFANKYQQDGRPEDEHRFQVKYGSDFTRYHRIYVAPETGVPTLMFGVHLEKGVFIAVDPSKHAVTWFSRSIEFKTHRLDEALETSWLAWERERVPHDSGRRPKGIERPDPLEHLENSEDESLLAFTPDRFLRYVQFERLATGMQTGERMLLAERVGAAIHAAPIKGKLHPLEAELGLSANDILDLIGSAFRLKVAVRGNAAERHLLQVVRETPGVSDVVPIDEDGKPDLRVFFEGRRRPALIECKIVGRTPTKKGPKVDFQKTRAAKDDPCSRYYRADQFDILAACIHPISERWDDFRFCATSDLDVHGECPGRLDHRVYAEGKRWSHSLRELLRRCTA